MKNKIALVVPCYNEEEVLHDSKEKLLALMQDMIGQGLVTEDSCIYFVDDGSKDNTWQLIEHYSQESMHIQGIKLAHNVGHQKALLAGLLNAEGQALISIDADLQDDIYVIPSMIQSYLQGNDVVFGVRESRGNDTFFKKTTAEGFYTAMKILGVETVYNHADFRLMSRRAVEALRQYKEVNLFLRALIPLLGFSVESVFYTRKERLAGESKYPLKKMLSFAWDGITSFSIVPLRCITALGFLTAFTSALYAIYVLYQAFFTNDLIQGWATVVMLLLFLGGIQLLCVGLIGEYVGKMYQEVKARPRFYVEKNTAEEQQTSQRT